MKHIKTVMGIFVLFGRNDAFCIHPLFASMLISLIEFILLFAVCVFCVLLVMYQREQMNINLMQNEVRKLL